MLIRPLEGKTTISSEANRYLTPVESSRKTASCRRRALPSASNGGVGESDLTHETDSGGSGGRRRLPGASRRSLSAPTSYRFALGETRGRCAMAYEWELR